MRTIAVANPKGGSGKSTLAIHLAAWFARAGRPVCLADLDRQQSSRLWLKLRPAELAPIRPWKCDDDGPGPAPAGCEVGILDTAAGLRGKALKTVLAQADRIVVPVSPSRFDMLASEDFLAALADTKAVRKDRVEVAIVGMRVDPRTQASRRLVDFLQRFELPLVTCLRQTQRYVQASDTGVTLFDLPDHAATAPDRLQWAPLLGWLESGR